MDCSLIKKSEKLKNHNFVSCIILAQLWSIVIGNLTSDTCGARCFSTFRAIGAGLSSALDSALEF